MVRLFSDEVQTLIDKLDHMMGVAEQYRLDEIPGPVAFELLLRDVEGEDLKHIREQAKQRVSVA